MSLQRHEHLELVGHRGCFRKTVPRFITSDNMLKLLCDNIIPRKKENQRKLDLDYKAKGDKDKIFKDKLV